jgi:hypothetical protein
VEGLGSLGVVLLGLAGCALVAAAAGVLAWRRTRQYPALPAAHAHNDYRRRRPLTAALAQGFASVEADVWPVGDALLVGHDEADLEPWRTLRALYLDPLAARLARDGRLLPGYDGAVQLLVEVKADRDRAWELLDAELRRYAGMLTRYERSDVVLGPVTVVITGKPPRAALAAAPVRYAACDGSLSDVGSDAPPNLVPLCSDRWSWHFRWDGRGPMPDAERETLRRLVADAHADGRRVRFWDVPASSGAVRRAVWKELREAGVDHLGADRLGSLRSFLRR